MIPSAASLTEPVSRLPAVVLLALLLAFQQVPPAHPDEPSVAPAQPEEASPRAPLPPPGEMARCKLLIDNGQLVAARMRLEPIVEQHPKWARATSLLALTDYKERRFEVAEELFARALEAAPRRSPSDPSTAGASARSASWTRRRRCRVAAGAQARLRTGALLARFDPSRPRRGHHSEVPPLGGASH